METNKWGNALTRKCLHMKEMGGRDIETATSGIITYILRAHKWKDFSGVLSNTRQEHLLAEGTSTRRH
jgi:hypothetical protein